MYSCPSCHSELVSIATGQGIAYSCPKCLGLSIPIPVLRRLAAIPFVEDLLTAARDQSISSARNCPFCSRPMMAMTVVILQRELNLDYCRLCAQVWFDDQEHQVIPQASDTEKDVRLEEERQERLRKIQNDAEKDVYWRSLGMKLGDRMFRILLGVR